MYLIAVVDGKCDIRFHLPSHGVGVVHYDQPYSPCNCSGYLKKTNESQMIIDLLIETNLSLVFTVSLSKETGLELVPAIAMLVYFQKLSSLGHKQYALQ